MNVLNTFDLDFINVELSDWRSQVNRKNTTCAQLFSASPQLYYPKLEVVLSSNGRDWAIVLQQLRAFKTQPFYADDVDRSVEFFVTFDFAYSSLSKEVKSEFIDKAKLALL